MKHPWRNLTALFSGSFQRLASLHRNRSDASHRSDPSSSVADGTVSIYGSDRPFRSTPSPQLSSSVNAASASSLSQPPSISPLLKKTGKSLLKSALGTLKSIGNTPPLIGLGPAAGTLLSLIEGIEETKENAKGFQQLAERISRIADIVQDLKKDSLSEPTLKCLGDIEKELREIGEDIKGTSQDGWFISFLNSHADKHSLAGHVASLERIKSDFMMAIGVDTHDVASESLAILRNMEKSKDSSSTDAASPSKTNRPKGVVAKLLWKELVVSQTWKEVDCDVEGEHWVGGTYSSYFPVPEYKATYILRVTSSLELSWTLETPADSPWFPGRHHGRIVLSRDHPFKPPRVFIDSPLFTPAHDPGRWLCVDMLWTTAGEWLTSFTMKDILNVVAFMLVVHPLHEKSRSDILPGIPLGFNPGNRAVYRYYSECIAKRQDDKFMRATRFFSRAYAQPPMDIIHNQAVSRYELEASRTVIQELLEFYTGRRVLQTIPGGFSTGDPEVAFGPDRITSLVEWAEEERRWAKEILSVCQLNLGPSTVEWG